jgi:cation-transporting ATPase E/undecaprenyl-diphosphatase
VVAASGFECLPELVAEGRRVLSNVERSANLFLAKTCYVLFLALGVALAGVAFPQLPRHATLTGTMTIGVPAFFLSLSRAAPQARKGFVGRVVRFTLPAGAFSASSVLGVYALTRWARPQELTLARTAATLTLGLCGLSLLRKLPNIRRGLSLTLIVAMGLLLLAAVAFGPVRGFLALALPPHAVVVAIAAATLFFNAAFRSPRGARP